MILGAGVYQVPLILKAKEMGLKTIVVSCPGNYPGLKFADCFLPVDTTNVAGVVNAAHKHAIDGIVTTGTDVCMPALGAVVDSMGLPGVSGKVANILTDKELFRNFLLKSSLPTPGYGCVSNFKDALKQIDRMNLPLIIKPVDSSGSRGVGVLTSRNVATAHMLFRDACLYSISQRVCVEEVIPGVEVGGDAFICDGQIVFLAVTVKHMCGFLVRGHSVPHALSDKQVEEVRNLLQGVCDHIGYETGVLNFDLMVNGNQVVPIEIAGRPGGNGISDLIKYAYAVDVEEILLKMALGEFAEKDFGKQKMLQGCGSLVFGSSRSGTIQRLPDPDLLLLDYPEIIQQCFCKTMGDNVSIFRNNNELIGYIVFQCAGRRDYKKKADAILKKIETELVVN